MTSWTQPAKEEIDNYLKTVRASLSASGADATEVLEDLERHIHEEVQSSRLQTVTQDDVRRIVSRLGVPDGAWAGAATAVAEKESSPPPSSNMPPAPEEPSRPQPSKWLVVFGIAFPLCTLLLEFLTHFCGSTFFDPIPTYGHVLLVALVPISNFVLLQAIRNNRQQLWKRLAWLSSIAAGVALFYSLRYSFIFFPAILALLFFGMGLLPMTPLFSLIATLRYRKHLRQLAPAGTPLPRLIPGMLAGMLLVLALDIPVFITHAGMEMAASTSASTRSRGVQLLRWLGHENTMLRICYGQGRNTGTMDPYQVFMAGSVSTEDARSIYYRVHGRPFNSVPPPASFTTFGHWAALEREFDWDREQGGTSVAGRLKGLSMANSRIDGFVDAQGSVGYFEWTMEFKNVASVQREARAQIALPPGGVVSRLTLWVNGEEREAAFAGRGEVRQAYQNIVSQRRDPVLVTTSGPDRVLMQCFPVPPNGSMKIRVGITAPVELLDLKQGLLTLPSMLERNFSLPESFRHSVWLESRLPLETSTLAATKNAENKYQLRGNVPDSDLNRFNTAIRITRPDASPLELWAPDPRKPGNIVRQTITESTAPALQRLCIVLDTSRSMRSSVKEVAEVLQRVPHGPEVTVFMPRDEQVETITSSGTQSRETLANRLRQNRAVGGQDNLPALIEAWDTASKESQSVVVWIHGPQPMLSPSFESLKQRLDWHGQSVQFLDFPIEAGPNRLLEKIEGSAPVRTISRSGNLQQDLARLFSTLSSGAKVYQAKRIRQAEPPAAELAKLAKASDHITRLWAFDETVQKIRARQTKEAVELAATYQLVTPVSGAVVLENKTQYAQAGLTPVDPSTVPVVPEPKTWLLLALGLGFAIVYGKRRKIIPAAFGAKSGARV